MITSDERIKLLGHFEYEVRMIMRDLPSINPNTGAAFDVILINILTHIRILFEFFHGDENDEKNGHVRHYIPEWDKKAPEKIGLWYGRINEFLSHLSYARTKGDMSSWWPIRDLLYPHYRELIIRFLTKLPLPYKNVNLDKLLEDIKKT
jgi:hypothetical protein